MLMEKIEKGKVAKPRRLLLYGVHGVGKSTFAASAPSPIFIQTEDGLGGIECDKFPLTTSFADAIAALGELYTEKHQYQTVVIDSLDWLERLIWADVCRRRNVENIEAIGYAKGYVFALTQWREVLEGLTALRNDRGMAIVLIAHAKIERFEAPDTDAYDRYTPRLHKHANGLVSEWCDEVFFATYKVWTKRVGEGFEARTQAVGSGERIVYTAERPAYVAKSRLSLPGELPLDWEAYAQFHN